MLLEAAAIGGGWRPGDFARIATSVVQSVRIGDFRKRRDRLDSIVADQDWLRHQASAGFRFQTDTVLVRREGTSVILEPADDWPADYVESFAGAPADFTRPPQGKSDKRRKLA